MYYPKMILILHRTLDSPPDIDYATVCDLIKARTYSDIEDVDEILAPTWVGYKSPLKDNPIIEKDENQKEVDKEEDIVEPEVIHANIAQEIVEQVF